MAEATAKSVLGEISQGHLECPICFCRFKDPKMLDCFHSFCLNCLGEFVDKQEPKTDKITCPVCRRVTQLPDTGLSALANCFFLRSLVDEVNKQEQLLEAAPVTIWTCEECEEGLEAVSRCLDCDENICQICQAAHERSKHTKKHCIVKVDSLKQKGFTPQSLRKANIPKCQKHENEKMRFYCDTCGILTCGTCAALDHRTTEHKYSEITDAIKSFRESVGGVLQKFDESKKEFKFAEDSIAHARDRLKVMTDRACSDISAKEEEEIAKIRRKARLLKEEVNQISQERDGEFQKVFISSRDKMDRAERMIAAVKDLMQQADDFELLELKPKVMHNLQLEDELHFENAQHGRSFIGFGPDNEEHDADLGEILPEEEWQLREEFGTGEGDGEFKSANFVGCFSNGDIVVADTESSRESTFTSTGCYKTELTQIGEDALWKPHGVAITCDDQLLITEEDNVKVYDVNQQLMHQFSPSQDVIRRQSSYDYYCIAVNKKKRVAVVNTERKTASLHNLDGTLITVVSSSKILEDVDDFAISNKERLIFTSYDQSRLLCVDFAGNEVFSVNTSVDGTSMRPMGVCCDEAGDIYVTGYNEEDGHGEVHHYSPQGTHVGRVAVGLFWPSGLTFSPAGDLVVADEHSVKIFERVYVSLPS